MSQRVHQPLVPRMGIPPKKNEQLPIGFIVGDDSHSGSRIPTSRNHPLDNNREAQDRALALVGSQEGPQRTTNLSQQESGDLVVKIPFNLSFPTHSNLFHILHTWSTSIPTKACF